MWEEGTFAIDNVEFFYIAKVFPLGSEFGINGGRISKLQIYNKDDFENGCTWDDCIVHYDRGWNVKPRPCDRLGSKALSYVLSLYQSK